MGCRAQIFWFCAGLVHCPPPSATPPARSVPSDLGPPGRLEQGREIGQHEQRPREVCERGRQNAAGGAALEAEEHARRGSCEHERGVAGGGGRGGGGERGLDEGGGGLGPGGGEAGGGG